MGRKLHMQNICYTASTCVQPGFRTELAHLSHSYESYIFILFIYSLFSELIKLNILPWTVLCCTAQHYTTLYYIALHCTARPFALQCSAVHCIALHWSKEKFYNEKVLQWNNFPLGEKFPVHVWMQTFQAVCKLSHWKLVQYSALQRNAVQTFI